MTRLSRLLVVAAAAAAAALGAAATSAADVPTIVASATQIAFGGSVTLRGAVPAGAAGQPVELLSQACGFTEPVQVATATPGADGRYSFTLQPTLNTAFLVQVGDARSGETTISVAPAVQLTQIGTGVYRADVSVGAGDFFTAPALLQRYDARHKAWRRLASRPLKQASAIDALIAVSSATFHAHVPSGTKLRAYVPATTAAPCYRPSASRPIAG